MAHQPMAPSWTAVVLGLLCLINCPAGASRDRSEVPTAAPAWVTPPVHRSSPRTSSSNSCNRINTGRHRRRGQQRERPPRISAADGSNGGGSVFDGPRDWVWCAGDRSTGGISKLSISRVASGSRRTVATVERQAARSSSLRCSDAGGLSDRDGKRGRAAGAGTAYNGAGDEFREISTMSASQMPTAVTNPDGAAQPEPAATAVTAFFCGGGLDLDAGEMNVLVSKAPHILEMSASEQLAPQANRWLNTAGLGLTRKSLGRMVVHCPEVFLLNYESVLSPIVTWLMVDVRVPRNRVARLLEAFPLMLAKDLETELRPRHRWLMDSLQLQTKEARRLLSLVPELLHVSLEDTLTPACDWLMAAAGGCDMAGVGRISARSPELLITEPSVMQERLEAMAQDVFGGDEAAASAFFVRQPLLLSHSDRVGPLVRLMRDELKATVPEAVEVLANDPSTVEFQLETLVFPRLEAVRSAGVGDIVNGAPLPLSGKLKVLGKFSDARFAKWLKREGRPHQERELTSRSDPPETDDEAAGTGARLPSW
ncbi:unnamed protein product [Scytosiphon promiscuus]